MSTSQNNAYARYITAHAVVGSLGALIVVPAALLVGRYLRTWKHWAVLHTGLNVLTLALVVVTFALGNAALAPESDEYVGPGADIHHQLGLAVFIIVVVQAFLGIATRFTKAPSHNYVALQSKRNPLRIVHILFGIATAALLYAQVYTGFGEWNKSSASQTTTPRGIVIAFWVLFGIEVLLYLVGWPVMEILGRRRRASRVDVAREKSSSA